MKQKISLNFIVIFLLVLLLSFFLASALENPLLELKKIFSEQYFIWSALIYFILVVISTIFSPITIAPAIPFISKIFGSLETFMLTFIGILAGSIISFYLARKLNKNLLIKFFSENSLDWLSKNIPKNLTFTNILFFRLFTPPDGLSYYLGENKRVKFNEYFFATAFGLIPITFILSFGADAITKENKILFFFLIFAILIIISAKFLFKFLQKDKVKIITHPNNFHLDDLFAVATIVLFMEKRSLPYEIIRTNDREELAKYKKLAIKNFAQPDQQDKIFIIDVGNEYNPDYNFFDHHQKEGAILRENKVPYSSFGLVWKKYGEKLCGSKEVAKKIDFDIVLGVDANDNGLNLIKPNYDFFLYGLPSLKNSFFPLSGESADFDPAFLKVLEIFKMILQNEINWAEKKINDEKKLANLYAQAEDKRVLWIEENLSVGKTFNHFPELLFLVKKKKDGWIIHSVKENSWSKAVKQKMPVEWCGLRDEELEKECGIAGSVFCHKSGGFAVVKNKESAEKFISILLKKK